MSKWHFIVHLTMSQTSTYYMICVYQINLRHVAKELTAVSGKTKSWIFDRFRNITMRFIRRHLLESLHVVKMNAKREIFCRQGCLLVAQSLFFTLQNVNLRSIQSFLSQQLAETINIWKQLRFPCGNYTQINAILKALTTWAVRVIPIVSNIERYPKVTCNPSKNIINYVISHCANKCYPIGCHWAITYF